jgi:hypothetical protein
MMGKGGYNGGSTVLRFFTPRSRKVEKTPVPENYDFEERSEEIRRQMESRKRKLAKGQSLIEFAKDTAKNKKVAKKKKSKGAKKIKK